MKLSTSIVIPTYNGLKLLKKYLPSVVKHAHKSQIIIVDDASTDRTEKWLKDNYPEVQCVRHQENRGFATAVNTGFKTAKTDLVLLLNNDVKINKNTLPRLQKNFKNNKNLFAVGALEKLPAGSKRGKSIGNVSRGLVVHQAATNLEKKGTTFWVFAASGLFDRKKWAKLKGMDRLYAPAYWEDIDVSYRAWKAGYDCLFDPTATLKHEAEATMNKELGFMKTVYAFKNQILFFWKNITDVKYLMQHILWMPYHLIVTNIRSKGAFGLGLLLATFQLSQVYAQDSKVNTKRSDREIFEKIGA